MLYEVLSQMPKKKLGFKKCKPVKKFFWLLLHLLQKMNVLVRNQNAKISLVIHHTI